MLIDGEAIKNRGIYITFATTSTLHDENIHNIILATWLGLIKFTELNISEFWLLNFNNIIYELS